MTDLNKLRSEFEAWFTTTDVYKRISHQIEMCGSGRHHDISTVFQRDDLNEDNYAQVSVMASWLAWQEKAKAQAVPDTQHKLTDTYFWEGSDYVVDCPFDYDIELDKGEVLELQKWQRTESTKVYFANIYKDEENFEILQFTSKDEAENAVAENLKMLEASESGAEG
ncbi:hypothetical protein [Acinetobacter pittii]|uniref:hypothetical protein n=1 Tax=Acinetobacter pittii TaxID=48296 RepID=UPI0025AF764C|nr:hypothetical protein [Acinetobacter pittii]